MGVTFPPPDAPRTRGASPRCRAVPLSFCHFPPAAGDTSPFFLSLATLLGRWPWGPCAVGCGFCPSASGRSLCCAARSAGARPTLSGWAFLSTGALEHCVWLTFPQRVPLGPRPVPLAGTHVAPAPRESCHCPHLGASRPECADPHLRQARRPLQISGAPSGWHSGPRPWAARCLGLPDSGLYLLCSERPLGPWAFLSRSLGTVPRRRAGSQGLWDRLLSLKGHSPAGSEVLTGPSATYAPAGPPPGSSASESVVVAEQGRRQLRRLCQELGDLIPRPQRVGLPRVTWPWDRVRDALHLSGCRRDKVQPQAWDLGPGVQSPGRGGAALSHLGAPRAPDSPLTLHPCAESLSGWAWLQLSSSLSEPPAAVGRRRGPHCTRGLRRHEDLGAL